MEIFVLKPLVVAKFNQQMLTLLLWLPDYIAFTDNTIITTHFAPDILL